MGPPPVASSPPVYPTYASSAPPVGMGAAYGGATPMALPTPGFIASPPRRTRGAFLYLALGFAAVMVAVLATYAGYLVLGQKRAREGRGAEGSLDDAESAVLSGAPQDLAKAD